jgi:hypothetical protein
MVSTGAAGGQAGGYLRFTNQAATPCKLTGWPRVSALTGSGRAVAAAHARSTTFGAWQYTPPLPVLRLAPGSSAYAVIESDNLPAGRATSCPPPYRSLRVAPPGGSQAVTISAWLPGANSYLPACRSIRGTATIAVSAVVLLATLPH